MRLGFDVGVIIVVIRIWRCLTTGDDVNQYLLYLRSVCLFECRIAEGNHSMQVLTRIHGTYHEVVCISTWNSQRDLEAFFGSSGHKEYEPEKQKRWLVSDTHIEYYDMVANEVEMANFLS
jgi:heme-degrading monooxygenase HmoA